ncbi:hypothetical protein PF008_g19931 [Phytophthora fragariae]|uniref:Uncharacterized protein n=1 Tax=Phytophthora fragariae TaxID=53985 RepID=A0A6G0R0Y7_9STRA|nr:hypothetical protein PF008_g19931 [Phytophthora fragariae]
MSLREPATAKPDSRDLIVYRSDGSMSNWTKTDGLWSNAKSKEAMITASQMLSTSASSAKYEKLMRLQQLVTQRPAPSSEY